MGEELQKLKNDFGDEIIDQSWYYCALRERHNQLTNQQNNKNVKLFIKLEEKSEKELKKIKYEFLRDSLKLINPEVTNEWISFINKNMNNPYYINIIDATIRFMNEINNGKSIEDSTKKILKNDFDLSGFQLGTLQKIISIYFDNSISIFNVKNKPILVSIDEIRK